MEGPTPEFYKDVWGGRSASVHLCAPHQVLALQSQVHRVGRGTPCSPSGLEEVSAPLSTPGNGAKEQESGEGRARSWGTVSPGSRWNVGHYARPTRQLLFPPVKRAPPNTHPPTVAQPQEEVDLLLSQASLWEQLKGKKVTTEGEGQKNNRQMHLRVLSLSEFLHA